MTWRGQNIDKSQIIKAPWGTAKQKVSSLVLNFENPKSDLWIKSIRMPRIDSEILHSDFNIDCDGEINQAIKINPMHFNHFILKERCLFPSNYMWLKHFIYQKYPGSTLNLQQNSSFNDAKRHLVNQSYTSNLYINSILYTFIALFLSIIFKIRNSFQPKSVVVDPWYRFLIKKILMHKLLPYHLVFSYSVILAPTLLIFILLAYFKFPTLTAFNDFPMYFLWAVIQQFVLGYLLAERIFYNRIQNKLIASLFAGLVFAIFHMPSIALMLATFIGGTCWALAWLWFKRFIPLAISHALLALMFYYVMPAQYLYSAKVLQWFWE
jgi:hypothetical protein